MPKLVRITTMPISLAVLLRGQMSYMREKGFEVVMVSSDGEEVEELVRREGCPHIPVRLTRKITPVSDLAALIRLTLLLRRLRPDIVHTHTPKAGLIGMWAAKWAGVPVRLHTIAGLPWTESRGLMRRILKTVEKITALAAHRVYPNSQVQKDFMTREGIGSGKLKVLGHGSSNGIAIGQYQANNQIRAEAARLRTASGCPDEGWVWVFVGRVVRDKGIMELMEAFATHQADFPQDRLWLVGNEEPDLDPLDEPYRHRLHHPPAYMTWWGYQRDIRPYLAAARVLVFPSYREGFPNVPLQAACMGCALILTDINGCNEIVESETDGLLVPVKDAGAIVRAMKRLRQDPDGTRVMAERIREKVISRYDQETLWRLLLEEYQMVLTQLKHRQLPT